MIKIRYSELPAGLHVRVEAHGRSTVIYLLPGLTLAQRRAALLRARRSACMGYGPRLPVAGVAAAVTRDRIRATLRNGTAAFRAHPILLLPMVVVLSAAMVYIMTSAVTITIHSPQGGSVPGLTLGQGPHHGPRGQGGYHLGVGSEVAPNPSVSSSPERSGRPTRSPGPRRSSSPTPGTSSPTPTSPSPGPSSPAPGTSTSPPASPTPAPSSSGTCVDVGPLGICLHL